jgi:hypothetical protein
LGFISAVNEEKHLLSLYMSYYLTKLAIKYLNEGETNYAWSAVFEASYYCANISVTKNERSVHSKGGDGRFKKNIEPARNEVIRLLKEKCPPEKWETENVAAKAIVHDSIEFMKEHRISLMYNVDTHAKTILRWIKEIPEVRAAFQECCSKKKK